MSNHTVDNQPSLPARPSQQPVKNDSALAANQPVQFQARAARQFDVNENDQSSSSTDSPRRGRGRPRKQQELANIREDEHAAVASESDQSSSSMDPPLLRLTLMRTNSGSSSIDASTPWIQVVRHEFVQWRAAELRPVADPNRCLSDAQQTRWKKDSLITRKKVNVEPEIRNDESHIQERREYPAMAIRWLDDTVIYIDEAGYNRELHAATGYAVVGDPVIVTRLSQKGLNLNVIAAMTPHEMLYWECSFESTDANRYAKFIDSMIRCNPNLFNNEHCHLVHDGVPFHKSPQVLEVLDIQRLQHFFHVIPAYSPSLNAIENAWKVVRVRDSVNCSTDRFLFNSSLRTRFEA